MPEQDGLFARTGKDSINIAGHKVPIAAVAGAIALVGVILVLRARQSGQNVATVGQAPYTAAATGFGATPFAPDYSGALANLSAQLTQLQQGNAISGPPAPAPVTSVITGNPSTIGWAFQNAEGQQGVPLYSMGPGGTLVSTDFVAPFNALLKETGNPITDAWSKTVGGALQPQGTFYPVQVNGQQYYISDVQGTTQSI